LEIQIGQNARTIYTYTGSQALLTDASNAFVTGNTAITNLMLGVSTVPDRDKLFDIVRKDSFGDVIHSEPAVVFYSSGADGYPDTADDDVKIFVGTNDGQLHCIDDATGNEVWSFVPPDQLGRLLLLSDNAPDHEYFVDGSPTVYYGSSQKILVIGSRRGGESYTALDITNYNAPRYLYSIGPDVLGPTPSTYERLGQSWSRPEKVTIATSSVPTISGCGVDITVNSADVFLFAGGYDNENQDLEVPSASDGFGRAVFAANMATGALINNLKFSPATHSSLGMTHSVVDVAGFDHDGDGIVSRIYFGDLGGNIFALKDDQVQTFTVAGCPSITKNVVDGVWSGIKLFQAPESNGKKLKILYAPDAVAEKYPPSTHGEYIYFGTGDREDPGNTAVTNRFYAVKNDWTATSPLTESNLLDVTDDLIQLGTAEQQQAVRENLELKKGWYIRLENQGEKVVSSPRVYAGVVYFTTYTPAIAGDPADPDPCAASTASGIARLYALNYKNGASVTNFNASGETDTSGNPLNGLGKLDRSLIVGTAIPSAPVIAILAGGARIFIGVEGGLVSLPAVASQDMIRYYWNQIF
jgi:type IV pilus assembly protein PilY1